MPGQEVAADSLRRVLDGVFAAPAYRWVEHPQPLAGFWRWWRAVGQWFWALSDRHPLVFDILVAAMAALLVAILVHVCWIFVRTLRAPGAVSAAPSAMPEPRDQAWYRREADRLAAAGHYVEAIQADFLALVLALDAARVLRFHPSKTPAEYLAEIRVPAEVRGEFRTLVGSLYGFAFARRPCDATAWAAWRVQATAERYATPG